MPSSIRRYIGMFETSVRQSALNYFAERGPKAIVAHVAEGMRSDEYNRKEYEYTKMFGLNQKGLVIIHGVGLDRDDLRDAARNDISIVWSPFSNLLLYGETLDVAAAKAAGVNLTLGVDWTPTGSKNILDELKIARRYLDKARVRGISNKDLVDMVTINAAKALQLEREMGEVKPGFLANLTLLNCPKRGDAYDCAVGAEQKDVTLVVANGHGLYGDADLVTELARAFRDDRDPDQLPKKASRSCDFKKAVRYQPPTDYDSSVRSKGLDMRSVEKLEQQLDAALRKSESRKQKVGLDPLFKCEDEKYAKRFDEYFERELDQNLRRRPSSRRSEFNLLDSWTPFQMEEGEGDEEDEH